MQSQKDLLAEFKKISKKVDSMEASVKKIDDLETAVASLKSQVGSSPSSSSSPEEKQRIPSQLTVSVVLSKLMVKVVWTSRYS